MSNTDPIDPNTIDIFGLPEQPFSGIHSVKAHLAGWWDLTLATGETVRTRVELLGKTRRGGFEITCVGISPKGCPKGMVKPVQFCDILSAARVTVDEEAVAARVAARMANRKRG